MRWHSQRDRIPIRTELVELPTVQEPEQAPIERTHTTV